MLAKRKEWNRSENQFSALYDILIDENSLWRLLHDRTDWETLMTDINETYSLDIGRPTDNPERLLKACLLKNHYHLSDRDLVKRLKVDMEMKYFLDYSPDAVDFFDPSLLSKFRTTHLKNCDLINAFLAESLKAARQEGVLPSSTKIIVDSTHTCARYHHISPIEELLGRCKRVRKAAYEIASDLHDQMPSKTGSQTGMVEDTIVYCNKVLDVLHERPDVLMSPAVFEAVNYLLEGIEDTECELEYSKDQDARIGHKTAETSFFGFKTHLAMTPEGLITAAVVTSGEKHDGKQLPALIENSEKNGIAVSGVIGDKAYSEKDNLEYSREKGIPLVSALSETVLHGNRKNGDRFEFNKDSGMYVCQGGHQAVKKVRSGSQKDKNGANSQVILYFFDINHCRMCPHKEGCYKEGAKSKTFSVKIKTEAHNEQKAFMETEEFKEDMKERYKIEQKNAHLKNRYNYGQADGCGLAGMNIQAAGTLFLANMKRIQVLREKKQKLPEEEEKTAEPTLKNPKREQGVSAAKIKKKAKNKGKKR